MYIRPVWWLLVDRFAERESPETGAHVWHHYTRAAELARVIALASRRAHSVAATASPDPDFEAKAKDILGLYLHPPEKAAVCCVDEKTAIEALDRTQPALPLRPGRPERHTVEYVRHGTVSLFAALEVHSGKVLGRCAPRHNSEAFVEFLEEAVARHRRKTIHVILAQPFNWTYSNPKKRIRVSLSSVTAH